MLRDPHGCALEINPSLARVHHSRGTIFHALERAGRKPSPVINRPSACSPTSRRPIVTWASSYSSRAGYEAIRCYRRSLELNSDYSEAEVAAAALTNMGNAFKDQARVEEAIECYRKAIDVSPDSGSAYENLLYALYFSPDQDAASIFEEHRRWEM